MRQTTRCLNWAGNGLSTNFMDMPCQWSNLVQKVLYFNLHVNDYFRQHLGIQYLGLSKCRLVFLMSQSEHISRMFPRARAMIHCWHSLFYCHCRLGFHSILGIVCRALDSTHLYKEARCGGKATLACCLLHSYDYSPIFDTRMAKRMKKIK